MFTEFPAMARITSHGWFQSLIGTVHCTDQRLKSAWVGIISNPGTYQTSQTKYIYHMFITTGLQPGILITRAARSVLVDRLRQSTVAADPR